MANYRLRLTTQADKHLERIYIEGFERWGEQQADLYFTRIITHFDSLLDNPYLFMAVDHIKPGYRRSVCGAHTIYYRIVGDVIEVAGLLKRQNPEHL